MNYKYFTNKAYVFSDIYSKIINTNKLNKDIIRRYSNNPRQLLEVKFKATLSTWQVTKYQKY